MASKKKVKKDEELIEVPVDKTSTDATFDVSNESVSVSCSGDNSSVTEVVVEEKPKKGTSKRGAVAKNDEELVRLRELNAKMQDELSSQVADNERLSDELGVANVEIKSLRKELSKAKQDNKRLAGENKANDALIKDLHNESVREHNRLDELKAVVSKLQKENKDVCADLVNCKSELQQRDNDLDGAIDENRELRKCYSALDASISKLKGRKWWKRIIIAFEYIFKGDKVLKG